MDIELYNQEKGSGEPLILLHGNGENRTYFENQMEFFQSGYRVIALDTRGPKPFTIEQFSCDLYDFMKSREISKAVILGFSDGANIAMKFAIRHPGMVKALILNGGNLNAAGVKRTTQFPLRLATESQGILPKARRRPKGMSRCSA